MAGPHTLAETERQVNEKLVHKNINFEAMAVISNLFRAANSVRNHLERTVLAKEDGTFKRAIEKTGRVYTTGALVDPNGTFLHLIRMLDQLNIGVFAGNHEFSPSQYEINLWHSEAMDAADRTAQSSSH